MIRLFVFWVACGAQIVLLTASANTLKYNPPMAENDAQKAYFVALLKRVCEHSNTLGSPCKLEPVKAKMYQQRQLRSLDEGLLDVMWTVTSIQREKDYLPVRIPLTKGLIGYRIAGINNAVNNSFQVNTPLTTIKNLQHMQGHDWPDSDILRFNDFEVSTTSWYSTLYKALDEHHYDVLLRGVLEVTTEFALYNTQHVSIDMHHAFYYPSAIYYFVSKKRPEIANLLFDSLTSLKTTGEFDDFLFNFPPHSRALAQLELDKRKMHLLENPLLPPKTPLSNEQLWFVNRHEQQTKNPTK